jgi:SAM-dependent methyltransferase
VLTDPPDHAAVNRAHWNLHADEWVAAGERAWTGEEPTWGIWGVPESELHMLPDDMTGMRAVELGCGTGYVSAWMARRGATVTGIDISEGQLVTARRLNEQHGLGVTFVHGNAEQTPFEDASFDFAISEYGAAIWCDPTVWLPEARRILVPGGRLVFLGNHPLVMVCSPWNGDVLGQELIRPYFEMNRIDWTDAEIDPGGIEFNRPIGEWFALFDEVGFDVEGFMEPRPAEPSDEVQFFTTAAWAYRYPTEQVWKLRRRG